jgi:hypothetical protein
LHYIQSNLKQMSLLQNKLESGRSLDLSDSEQVRKLCEVEICALHATFVTWFRGEQSLAILQEDLQQRMMPEFSHVAPNGHMVKGRDVLLQYLIDKYGCYQDRVFSIDVYNVELLWCKRNLCLVSYEEWQSWDDTMDQSENGYPSSTSGKQQFGRLSTCMLERVKDSTFRWIHVHETWMENEEPIIKNPTPQAAVDEETVMTGPALPNETNNRTLLSQRATPLNNSNSLSHVLRPSQNGDDDDDDDDEDDVQDVIPTPSNIEHPEQPKVNPLPPQSSTSQYKVKVDSLQSTDPSDIVNDIVDDDEEDEEEDYDEDDEFNDDPGSNNSSKVKLTPEEQKFLEASQGILVFEEDEDNVPTTSAPVSQRKLASNGITLDDLIESDRHQSTNIGDAFNHNISQKIQSADQINNSSQAMLSLHSAADASHKRHVSPNLAQYAIPLKWDDTLVGVSIAGFDIGTSQGPIANADWYTINNKSLEEMSQPTTDKHSPTTKQQRKIILPEMVYPIAHVALEGHGIWLSWDATDCLKDWASSHSQIEIHATSDVVHNGVSVLKTKDAKLWDKRIQKQQQKIGMNDATAVFHYDWTYSSPFSVKMEGGNWIELEESGMRMDLLTDQNAPILFFDEIVLYEDDLHDNGHVQYSIKLRIMPTCAYILARLWVRVDKVLVRVRETRVLVDFFGIQPQVYRDIAWRACPWDELDTHGLPTTVNSWSCENGETAEWHNLLQRLPEEKLPNDIISHAVLEYGKSASDDVLS